MIRIRFHGRGGHGVKTASRIVGTAAFHAGFQCQDSPVYGAERRGAAVTAFTRISTELILERGMIADPDLIVLADETLLSDPTAAVLAGQKGAAAIFINCTAAEGLIQKHGIHPPVYTFDVTGRTREVLGHASALSAGLGAAAARLTGIIDERTLVAAMREEFEHLGVPPDVVVKNVQIGSEVFGGLPALELRGKEPIAAGTMAAVEYHDPVRGAPSVVHAGNAEQRQTGAWRVERPIIDRNVCTRCGLCFVECPDGAISLDAEGYPVIDYDHCKGCMICRQLCPLAAIGAEQETRAW